MNKKSKIKDLSPIQRKVISEIEQMDETELIAVKAFINSLDQYKKVLIFLSKNDFGYNRANA